MITTSFKQMHKDIGTRLFNQWLKRLALESLAIGIISYFLGIISARII